MTEPNPLASIETAWAMALDAASPLRVPAPRETFYASSIGHCYRKVIAERAGIPPLRPIDRRTQFKFWIGSVLGKEIAVKLESVGFLLPDWTEKRFEVNGVSGKVDGYTEQILGGAVVEIKTADDRAVTKYELPEHYAWQLQWYLMASGVKHGLILMVGKGQGIVKHQVIPASLEWESKLKKEIDTLHFFWKQYTNTGTLPGHRHQFSWEDKYCPYMDLEEALATQHEEVG